MIAVTLEANFEVEMVHGPQSVMAATICFPPPMSTVDLGHHLPHLDASLDRTHELIACAELHDGTSVS